MDTCIATKNTGLRDVVVASTRISDVNGAEGKLIYRGYLIKDLAEQVTFEEVAYLLLYEKLPDQSSLDDFQSRLAAQRTLPEALITALRTFPATALPMDVLQATVAMLAPHDPQISQISRAASMEMAVRLVARLATVVAAWDRIRNGREPVAPDPELSHAANFLYMLHGKRPDAEVARFLDTALVLHAEHSFNASTFAAREVASTRAHMYAAVAAAVGSLSGELHGGANTRVMQMLMEIGRIDRIDDYIEKMLDQGKLIMGLGHAVYQTDDPRAYILAPMARAMGGLCGERHWYEIAEQLEKKGKAAFKARKSKEIFVNVDFYSAPLYHCMGIPMDLFTPLFAVSRIAGWCAHVLEEQLADAAPKPVLYRPESEYVGDYCGPAECAFVPLAKR